MFVLLTASDTSQTCFTTLKQIALKLDCEVTSFDEIKRLNSCDIKSFADSVNVLVDIIRYNCSNKTNLLLSGEFASSDMRQLICRSASVKSNINSKILIYIKPSINEQLLHTLTPNRNDVNKMLLSVQRFQTPTYDEGWDLIIPLNSSITNEDIERTVSKITQQVNKKSHP